VILFEISGLGNDRRIHHRHHRRNRLQSRRQGRNGYMGGRFSVRSAGLSLVFGSPLAMPKKDFRNFRKEISAEKTDNG